MKKALTALKHGVKRVTPLLLAGGLAILGSASFRHYVENHPQVAAFVPVLVWLLHTLASAKQPAA